MAATARVNGVELWYEVTGEGEPVIQIHGAGFGHFNFAPATAHLARHFQVVDYDMRGYGQSDRPVQRYDMEVCSTRSVFARRTSTAPRWAG